MVDFFKPHKNPASYKTPRNAKAPQFYKKFKLLDTQILTKIMARVNLSEKLSGTKKIIINQYLKSDIKVSVIKK